MNRIKSNQEYRSFGAAQMEGRYQKTIILLLILYAFNALVIGPMFDQQNASSLGSLGSLVNLAISAALAYSLVDVWLGQMEKKDPQLEAALLDGFKHNYLRNLLLKFLMSLFTGLWMLLLIVPGIIAAYRYSMAFYIVHREPDLDALAAISRSKALTQGHKSQLFSLDLSYLGWYFLGIFTCGILWLWVIPKHMTARMALVKDIYDSANPEKTVAQ